MDKIYRYGNKTKGYVMKLIDTEGGGESERERERENNIEIERLPAAELVSARMPHPCRLAEL